MVESVVQPQVSVILPYYNGDRWIFRSLRSVMEQEGVVWELIIVDDGSQQVPLSTLDIEPLACIRSIHIDHAGKGAALNRGVSEAKADVVCFIDQDDIMNPGRLKMQYQAFVDHPQADVVYSDYERIYDDGRLSGRCVSHQASSRECLKSMARSMGLISMQTIMIKESLFHAIGGFSDDVQLTGLDDAEFFVRLFASGCVLQYVPGIVQKWVSHEQNYSESAAFQETRLIFLQYLSNYAASNPLIRAELPYFQYHAFFMRGIFYLQEGLADRAVREYLKAVKVRPLNLNGYYLLLKAWMKSISSRKPAA